MKTLTPTQKADAIDGVDCTQALGEVDLPIRGKPAKISDTDEHQSRLDSDEGQACAQPGQVHAHQSRPTK